MSHEGAGAQSGPAANVTAPEIGSSALFGGVVFSGGFISGSINGYDSKPMWQSTEKLKP